MLTCNMYCFNQNDILVDILFETFFFSHLALSVSFISSTTQSVFQFPICLKNVLYHWFAQIINQSRTIYYILFDVP